MTRQAEQPSEQQSGQLRVEAWSGAQLRERMTEAMTIYIRAMGYAGYTGAQRAVAARTHTEHRGFACQVASLDGTMVGFGYGYASLPGQHWHDLVRRALSPELAAQWLPDSFELSELHVDPNHQAHGVGQALLRSMAERLPERRILLSTPDSDTRAFRMYRKLGFLDLARNYLFPGDARPFAVLGADLPLRPGDA